MQQSDAFLSASWLTTLFSYWGVGAKLWWCGSYVHCTQQHFSVSLLIIIALFDIFFLGFCWISWDNRQIYQTTDTPDGSSSTISLYCYTASFPVPLWEHWAVHNQRTRCWRAYPTHYSGKYISCTSLISNCEWDTIVLPSCS